MSDQAPDPIDMETMRSIFEVADELEISRESIQVPLLPEGNGSVRRLSGGRIEIVVPVRRPLADWLPELRRRLEPFAGNA